MLVTGILIAFLDVPAEDAAAFARWYDLDHLPEHVSKPDVVAARRYAAATDVPDDTGSGPARVIGGHAPYLTVYSFGGSLDFAGDDALAGWAAKDAELRAAKRLWRTGRVLHTSRWRLTGAHASAAAPVSPDAVPHLPHRGVLVALGPDTDPVPEVLGSPGVLGALTFFPADDAVAGLALQLALCELPALEVQRSLPTGVRDSLLPYDRTPRP